MNLKESLEDFHIKIFEKHSRETLLRILRRITHFSFSGFDVFNLNSQQIYNHCAKRLENGKMKKSLRREIEDLERWEECTGQNVKIPHFKKEPDPGLWFPTDEGYIFMLLIAGRI